ncbi:DUF2461 domain-containing protein [Fulvivirga sp. M361]|uniref:DUF2461 domain-containing protein n=1 Tax=Fulvivirga sp. M361 TaxID=2594266 RepID=UPI00117B3ECB|nr:DUF2461 domain-containing protein [Fulvivirga sp. M361]TRX58461.1 DUF2461 domain-containing protein [Fulvivirga sp. M361]
MSYFTKDFTAFFKELKQHNTKDWFDENRKRYEQSVKKPLYRFIDEMIGRINAEEPEVTLQAKDAVTRINRDIRFSPDKTPYNTHIGAVISSAGRKDKSVPGIFLRLDTEGVHVFGGAHGIDAKQVAKVRAAIAADPEKFMDLIQDKAFVDRFGTIKGEVSKRIPKELAEVSAKYPVIMQKSFYYVGKIASGKITHDDLPELVMEYWYTAKPVKDFLTEALNQN